VVTPSQRIGVLGATSFVGRRALTKLVCNGLTVLAISRRQQTDDPEIAVEWLKLTPDGELPYLAREVENWLCFAPIWTVPALFPLLEKLGVRRIVVFSSTSVFTKTSGAGSKDADENALAQRLADSEVALQAWATPRGVAWTVLRPTLIYGLNQDRNVSEVVRFIKRFGFFPLLGAGNGKRQPVHVDDVAAAAVSALWSMHTSNRAYNLSGAEVLSYREMVGHIFVALKKRPRFIQVPLAVFAVAVACLSVFPRYRQWKLSMAERMNRDQAFDHTDATRDFGFTPRAFRVDVD
jgi:nucleoside-diphosphate-sugar epimerase